MQEIIEVKVSDIEVGEHEQRLEKDDLDLVGLANSIKRVGVLQPILLEKKGDTLYLVSGHRRLQAAARAGKTTVPCIIKDGIETQSNEITFAENFFRRNLTPIELSCAMKDCIDRQTMTVEQLAAGFHKSEHWVRNMISISQWPGDVQKAIHLGVMSTSAASNLALVTDDTYRKFLLQNAVENGATARTTAAWLQAWYAMLPAAEAVQAEPIPAGQNPIPMTPQAPCLCCSRMLAVNMMSHCPICGECIQIIREVGAKLNQG